MNETRDWRNVCAAKAAADALSLYCPAAVFDAHVALFLKERR